jgi:hypothetical protein
MSWLFLRERVAPRVGGYSVRCCGMAWFRSQKTEQNGQSMHGARS